MKLAAIVLLLATSAAGHSDEPVDRITDALVRGLSASGPARVATRRQAAAILNSEGARAMPGGENIAASWNGRQPAYRTRVLGPAYRAVTLAPGGALHLEQTFLAGQRAQIVAAAIGRGAIELTVDEGEGRRSCPTQNRRARCDWIPTATTRISIDLYNRAAAPDRFVIILR